ncbi:MAG: hypothetical protein AAFU49_06770 [Pseudomonadota bacterium]
MMGPFTYTLLILIFLTTPIPMMKILARAGQPKWLAVLSIVPVLNVGLLWYVTLRPWPGDAVGGR